MLRKAALVSSVGMRAAAALGQVAGRRRTTPGEPPR